MDSESLMEIRNNIGMIPVLEEHMEKLRKATYKAEGDVKVLLRKYEAESLDVEKLKKESFSSIILKLIGKYDNKIDKETKEMIAAKIEYDKACDRINNLYIQKDELSNRIYELNRDKDTYDSEIKRREQEIIRDVASEVYAQYMQLEEERKTLAKQSIEIDEAIRAANRVKSTIDTAIGYLDSAEGWATYDVWTKGGIISHVAKYDNIDNAKETFNRLYSQIKDLEKELSDVALLGYADFSGIDGTTRAIDYWFDNIFTDLNVRSRIREDREKLKKLYNKISGIIYDLNKNEKQIDNNIKSIENRKKELIISR